MSVMIKTFVLVKKVGNTYRYVRYRDGKRKDTVNWDKPMTAEMVECFRVNPDNFEQRYC